VNGNTSEVLFDAFGMVIVSTHYGQTNGEAAGNLPIADYTLVNTADFDSVLSNPTDYLQGVSSYIYYDHLAWMTRKEPACAISLIGEKYQAQLAVGEENIIQIGIAYSDGFGRALAIKHKTDAGPVQPRIQKGQLVSPIKISPQGSWSDERWIVSGRTVYNNKGKPAQQYLSYYSDTPHYEDQATIEMDGLVPPPSILHYDALNRVVRTDTPKGFYSKVEFTPWFKAAVCQHTPSIQILDNLGRTIRSVKDNLGTLNADSFKELYENSSITSEEVISTLQGLGILNTTNEITYDWSKVVEMVQANLSEIADGLLALLYQGRITTQMTYDIQGRNITSVDSRLYFTICMEQQFTPTVAMLASPGSWTTNLANPFTVGTVEDLPYTTDYNDRRKRPFQEVI